MTKSSLPEGWTHFIYKAVCRSNGKVYIGLTLQSPRERWSCHRRDASKQSNTKFHRAIRKHGFDNFEFSVIACCKDLDSAKSFEESLIGEFNSFRGGYNSTLGGEGCKGYKMPKEHVEMLTKRNTGRKKTKEQIERMRAAALGFKHSDETKEKCRIAGKKRRTTEEYKQKLSDAAKRRYGELNFYNPHIGYFKGHIKDLCDTFPGVNDAKVSAVKNGKRNHHKNWVVLVDDFEDLPVHLKESDISERQVLGYRRAA